MTIIGTMKGHDCMDNYENEEIIQELTDLIMDGATDEMILEHGFSPEQIEEAHVNYLTLYF